MKRFLVAFAWMASVASAAAQTSLKDMIGGASVCSDASLREAAATTCDSPEKIAAMAFARCQSQWDAVANKAVGPLPANATDSTLRAHARSLSVYANAMQFEYVRAAELKAIDMRTADGRCGFD